MSPGRGRRSKVRRRTKQFGTDSYQMQALPPDLLQRAFEDPSPRSRLIVGMALALFEKSYATLSVADVVRLARVSKRTFYEHFSTREACYLATYEALSGTLLDRVEQTALSVPDVQERLQAAVRTYLTSLQEVPALARTFFLEIQLAGPDALTARRQVFKRFAGMLQSIVRRGREDGADIRLLTEDMALAIVGAINELMMVCLEEERVHALDGLQGTVVELFEALLRKQDAAPVELRSEAG
jgi:AcrR family transcriptional regulator